MKKLISAAAAVLTAVLLSLCASARSAEDFYIEYDYSWGCYILTDKATGEIMGLGYTDGSVEWFDGYDGPFEGNELFDGSVLVPETEEYPDPEQPEQEEPKQEEPEPENPTYDDLDTEECEPAIDPPEYYGREDQYRLDTMFLKAPTASAEIYEDYPVLISRINMGWKPEVCYIERRKQSGGSWERLGDVYDIWIEGSDYVYWFADYSAKEDEQYYYRFCYYVYFDLEESTMVTSTTEVYVNMRISGLAPMVEGAEISDTTVRFDISIDDAWGADHCIVSRRTSPEGPWKKLARVNEFTPDQYSKNLLHIVFTDSKLKQQTKYYYRFEFIDADGNSLHILEQDILTLETPKDPYIVEEAHSDSITIRAVVDRRWNADGYEIFRYSSKTKKWEKLSESEDFDYYYWDDETDCVSAEYTDTGLKSSTKYQYLVKLYRDVNGERQYFSKLKKSVYTLLPAPKLMLGATAKKANLSWNKVKGAAGYEVYVLPLDKGSDEGWSYWYWYSSPTLYTTLPQYDTSLSRYNQSYNSSTLYTQDVSRFTKKTTLKDAAKTSVSYNLKSGKVYVYIVRAYKKVGNTKVYSEFSNQESTDTTSSLLNGLTLKSKVTVSDYDLGLIKKALKKCVNSKMTPAEKAAAVYDYVHNAAIYEYDYSKIPTDPIEAILSAGRGQCYQYAVAYQAMMKYLGFDVKLVSGKTSSGGPHWWCELNCAGTSYMIDPQVGGRFLIRYDRMGGYAVTKEKVYD